MQLNNLVNVKNNLNAAVERLKDKKQLEGIINKYFLKNTKKIVIKQEPVKNKSQDPYKNIVGLQMP